MWRQIRRSNKPFPELNPQEMGDILSFLYRASNIDSPGDSGLGRQVFIEKGCVRCHSAGAEGGKVAPELSKIVTGDQTEWMSAMLNHAGPMVDPITSTLGQWPQFSGHEMTDLVAYINPAPPKAEKKSGYDNAGDVYRGALVFQERCAQCHSISGKGGTLGPALGPERELPLSPGRFAGLMWNHAPAMLKRGRETNTPVPFLHGAQMKDLLAFLESVRYLEPGGSSAVGKEVFAKRGCAACHGNDAEGTQSGPRLKTDQQRYNAVSFASALWRHGPRMIDRAEAMGTSWPRLESKDIGDLVSFLNDGEIGKKR
jgi:mono/diheme cytochrome c family protein